MVPLIFLRCLFPVADMGFTGKVSELEFGPCERSHLGNSESRSPGLSGSSNSAVGVSESSTVTIQEFECKNHSCPKASPHKFPGDFRRKKRRQTPVEGSTCPSSISLQNFDELDYDQKSLVSGLLSSENEKDSIEANKIGAILKKKRLRKTTQRLVEDSSKKKANDLMGSEKLSALAATDAATEDLRLKAGSQNKLHRTRPRTLSSVPEEDSISDNLTLSEFRIRIARPKKQVTVFVGNSILPIFLPVKLRMKIWDLILHLLYFYLSGVLYRACFDLPCQVINRLINRKLVI